MDTDKQKVLHSVYSDMYKERYNVRPRFYKATDLTVEEWEAKIESLESVPLEDWSDEPWLNY